MLRRFLRKDRRQERFNEACKLLKNNLPRGLEIDDSFCLGYINVREGGIKVCSLFPEDRRLTLYPEGDETTFEGFLEEHKRVLGRLEVCYSSSA